MYWKPEECLRIAYVGHTLKLYECCQVFIYFSSNQHLSVRVGVVPADLNSSANAIIGDTGTREFSGRTSYPYFLHTISLITPHEGSPPHLTVEMKWDIKT